MSITVAGNVTSDPRPSRSRGGARRTPIDQRTGQPVTRTKFWVLVSHDGPPTLRPVCARGRLAESIIAAVRRGDRVIVTGRLQEVRWPTTSGEGSELVLLADDVGLSLSHVTTPGEAS